MKKIIISIALIVLCIGIIIFLNSNQKILIIENIREKIAQAGENIKTVNDVTTIDVTYLEDNGNLQHEHILKTKFDENTHWEECTICMEKINNENHIYTSSWTMGSANACNETNIYKSVCTCGYSKETTNGRKSHTMKAVINSGTYQTYSYCTNCMYADNMHDCISSDGSRMNCSNVGICSICKTDYRKYAIEHYNYVGNEINCKVGENVYCRKGCSEYLGIVNKCELIKKSDNIYEFHTSITVPSGARFSSVVNENYFGTNVTVSNTTSTLGTNWNAITTINFIDHTEMKSVVTIGYVYKINGKNYIMYCKTENFSIDDKAPVISNISMENNEGLIEWSKTKPIIVSGTENYCNTVKVKIIDNENNIIFEGKGNVNNNEYSIACVPEINAEIGREEKTYKVIVTDALDNETEKEFKISKIDNIPPTPTSGNEITGNWSKSRKFIFSATDYGIGKVKIAFNDIKDLQLAKANDGIYSREYEFTGDVYEPKELSVMYKDGLENTSIQKIKIDKLDNTAPTITNVELHNNKLNITSHDEHKTLGEGSGVVKYRYLASEEKITNPELTAENSEESTNAEIIIKDIYKAKYIYIVAEDLVGNISKVYELEVPQLILTSQVNLNTADGKGEVILDWSTYNIQDKYFVIYRKENDETDWETIVKLEEKFNGDTYTDILANDKTIPTVPSITITGDAENNNIDITATLSDSGTKYTYYIESYDSIGTLISKSN